MPIIENSSVSFRCIHSFIRVGLIVDTKPKYRHVQECILEIEYDGRKTRIGNLRTKNKIQAFLLYKVLKSMKHAILNLHNEDPVISYFAQKKVNEFHNNKIKIIHEYKNHIPKSDLIRK
jgi:hypothetical protein